jgi:hypothetical protein
LIIGAAAAVLLVVGGTVWALSSGGDDKKPEAGKVARPSPGSFAPVNPGDGSDDSKGGTGTEDLNAGRRPGEAKVLWYKGAPDAPGGGADAPGMWITDNVAIKAAYKQVVAYTIDGGQLLEVLSCQAGKEDQHEELQELAPTTGKSSWTKRIPNGWQVSRVYSTNPVVLYFTNREKKQWNISTLKDGSSATRSQVGVKDSQGCVGATADASTLYLPIEARSGPDGIVAINLNTGKESWRVKSPGDTPMLPLKIQDGSLIAYEDPSYQKGGSVLSIPTGGDHKPKTLLQNPEGTAEIENGFYSKAIDYVDGRFYISTTRLTAMTKRRKNS